MSSPATGHFPHPSNVRGSDVGLPEEPRELVLRLPNEPETGLPDESELLEFSESPDESELLELPALPPPCGTCSGRGYPTASERQRGSKGDCRTCVHN